MKQLTQIQISVQIAEGGYVLTQSNYNPRTGSTEQTTYVATDDNSLAAQIAKIVKGIKENC